MSFLEKLLKYVPAELPDNGGSFLPPQDLKNTVTLVTPDSYLVKIALVKNVRDGDYEQVVATLDSIKKTPLDAETLIPWALDKIGYRVEAVTFTTKFNEVENLVGGMMLNEDQLASFRNMASEELNDDTPKLLGTEEASEENKELIKLSAELAGKEWQIINYRGGLNKGIRAIIVIKEKNHETVLVEGSETDQIDSEDLTHNPYLKNTTFHLN